MQSISRGELALKQLKSVRVVSEMQKLELEELDESTAGLPTPLHSTPLHSTPLHSAPLRSAQKKGILRGQGQNARRKAPRGTRTACPPVLRFAFAPPALLPPVPAPL